MSVSPASDNGVQGLVYVLSEDGQPAGYEEVQVHDMLEQLILTPATYFWKEGMAEWRPLSELPPLTGLAIVPPKRHVEPDPDTGAAGHSAAPAAEPIHHSAPISHAAVSVDVPTTEWHLAREYEFEENPVPVTIVTQILLVLSMVVTAFFIYECLSKINGWSTFSHSQMYGLNHFMVALLCGHAVVEASFLVWVYFASTNCSGLARNMTYTPIWSVASFFIPILNFFRPYQVMQEIWKVSENPNSWIGNRDSIFVGVWFFVRLSLCVLAGGPFRTKYSDSEVAAVWDVGQLIYYATLQANLLLVELTTLILVSIVTVRMVKWVRLSEAKEK